MGYWKKIRFVVVAVIVAVAAAAAAATKLLSEVKPVDSLPNPSILDLGRYYVGPHAFCLCNHIWNHHPKT